MPYKTPIGDRTYDTGEFEGHMDKAMGLADWTGFKDRLDTSRQAGKLRSMGLATYIECTAWGEGEDAKVRLEEDGTFIVFSGTQSNGQGHATAYAQFVAEHLDVPVDRVLVVQGDTGRVATGHGTGGSRSIPIGGVSVAAASQELSRKLKDSRPTPSRPHPPTSRLPKARCGSSALTGRLCSLSSRGCPRRSRRREPELGHSLLRTQPIPTALTLPRSNRS